MGNKIVMISEYDYAGSGYRIAEAVNLNSNNFVIPISIMPVDFPKGLKRMPALVKVTQAGGVIYQQDADRLQAIIDDADIVHFKGDELPSRKIANGAVTIPDHTPIIVTVHGSMFRRSQSEKVSMPLADVKDYVEISDFRTAGDPCLRYPDYDGVFSPVPFDFWGIEPSWVPSGNVISHSPSNRGKKGTKELIEAVESLQKKGHDIKLDIIENVSYQESVKRKKDSILFFDQLEAGFYGNSAIEAMAHGVPVACRMDPKAYDWSNGLIDPDCPIINTGRDIEGAIEYYLGLSPEAKVGVSSMTVAYAHRLHSYPSVAGRWCEIYENLLLQKGTPKV